MATHYDSTLGLQFEQRDVSSNAALALTHEDGVVYLAASTSGTKTATTSSSKAGQVVLLRLTAASGGGYEVAASSLTITLDAAGEGCIMQRNAANDAWRIVALLGGATAA